MQAMTLQARQERRKYQERQVISLIIPFSKYYKNIYKLPKTCIFGKTWTLNRTFNTDTGFRLHFCKQMAKTDQMPFVRRLYHKPFKSSPFWLTLKSLWRKLRVWGRIQIRPFALSIPYYHFVDFLLYKYQPTKYVHFRQQWVLNRKLVTKTLFRQFLSKTNQMRQSDDSIAYRSKGRHFEAFQDFY